MTYEEALAQIQHDLDAGKIDEEQAALIRQWLDQTVQVATRKHGHPGRSI